MKKTLLIIVLVLALQQWPDHAMQDVAVAASGEADAVFFELSIMKRCDDGAQLGRTVQ